MIPTAFDGPIVFAYFPGGESIFTCAILGAFNSDLVTFGAGHIDLNNTTLALANKGLFAVAVSSNYPFPSLVMGLDLSSPLKPVLGSSPSLPGGGVLVPRDVAIGLDDSYALALCGEIGYTDMKIVPVSLVSPLSPSPGTPVSIGSGQANQLVIAPNGSFGLVLYHDLSAAPLVLPLNLSDPTAPVPGTAAAIGGPYGTSQLTIAPNSLSGLVTNSVADAAIYTLDLTNPLVPIPHLVSLSYCTPLYAAYQPGGEYALTLNVSPVNTVSMLYFGPPFSALAPIVIWTITLDQLPASVGFSPDGSFAVVAQVADGYSQLTLLDTSNPFVPAVGATVPYSVPPYNMKLFWR